MSTRFMPFATDMSGRPERDVCLGLGTTFENCIKYIREYIEKNNGCELSDFDEMCLKKYGCTMRCCDNYKIIDLGEDLIL